MKRARYRGQGSFGPDWLSWHDLLLICAVAFPTGLLGISVQAALGESAMQRGVNAFSMAGAFLMAAVSLGRLMGQKSQREAEAKAHGVDPCVEAGEHIEGCVFMVPEPEPPPSPLTPEEAAHLTKDALGDYLGVSTDGLTKQELVDMVSDRYEQLRPPEDPMLGSTEMTMCVECGNFLDDSRSHVVHLGKAVDRCLNCAKHSLCLANPDGPHARVIWPEDPDYDPGKHQVGPLPDGIRVGYCPACLAEFREVGTDVLDVTWETVGLLWAAEVDPSLLDRRYVEAVCTSVIWNPKPGVRGIWVGFNADGDPYHFVNPIPVTRGDLLWQMVTDMGVAANEEIDDDALRIEVPRRQEKGKFRLTVNGSNEIVGIKALPCPECKTVHELETGPTC